MLTHHQYLKAKGDLRGKKRSTKMRQVLGNLPDNEEMRLKITAEDTGLLVLMAYHGISSFKATQALFFT